LHFSAQLPEKKKKKKRDYTKNGDVTVSIEALVKI
jgi:hypothetical protein